MAASEDQTRAYVFAALTVLFWATVPTAFKLVLARMPPGELVLIASLVSLLVLAAVLAWRGELRALAAWSMADYARSALLGFLNPFAYYLILLHAYDRLPAQEAQPLNMIWPLVLTLFSLVILKQRIRGITLLAMVVSFSGALTIATRGDILGFRVSDGLGVGLAMGSAVIWAIYWNLGVRDRKKPVARLCVNFSFGVLFTTAYLFVVGTAGVPGIVGLLGAGYIGLFEMGFAFVLWLKALQLSKTTAQVSNLIFVTPFLSLVLVHTVLGESLLPSTVAGLVLIVSGIILQRITERP